MKHSLYVCNVTHKHGTDVMMARSRRGIDNQLYEYVEQWWEDAGRPGPIPKNKTKAIDSYFTATTGREEYYDVTAVDASDIHNSWKRKWAKTALDTVDDEADTSGINNHIAYDEFFKAVKEKL